MFLYYGVLYRYAVRKAYWFNPIPLTVNGLGCEPHYTESEIGLNKYASLSCLITFNVYEADYLTLG